MVKSARISLCNKEECTGCMACYTACPNSSIQIVVDNEGFLYPEINHETCVFCEKCTRSCPVLYPTNRLTFSMPEVYAAWAKDIHVRTKGSSGGLFSVLALHILEDNGYVVGAAFDQDLQLKHQIIHKKQDLSKLQGSKYLQSYMGNTFSQVKRILLEGSPVLFVGTPCQIDGLYAYLGKNNWEKLYTCDLVCHGVPSPGWFKKYIERIKNKREKIVDFSFRDLCFQRHKLTVKTTTNTRSLYGCNSYFISAFLKGVMNRESCYTCKYASSQRIGDITLADFWGLGKRIPFNYDKKHGVSLVLVNTNKGDSILSQIKNKIVVVKRDLEEALEDNHQLHTPSVRPKERDTFFEDYEKLSSKELINNYHLRIVTRKSLILNFIIRKVDSIATVLHIKKPLKMIKNQFNIFFSK